MANYTPNGFSDGLFTGRVIAQNYDGSGNALRVDLSNNNALYVQDMIAKYDGSGRLLTYGPSQLMDQSNNYITTTDFNYSDTDFSKNYVQLDVFDVSANFYLKQIANKNFNVSGTYVSLDKVRIADGSNNFYTSVFNKVGDISYNQLATYDYSANKQLENIYGAVRSYTTTQHIYRPGWNSSIVGNYNRGDSNTSNYLIASVSSPPSGIDAINNLYNSFSRYVDLRNKNVTSLSFYGTVQQSCILVVQYANPLSNIDANALSVDPSANNIYYSGTSRATPQQPYTDFSGSIILSNYDLSGWFNTQYNTKITVATKGTATAFGFNVPFCNAQFVRLMMYDTNGQNIGGQDFTWKSVETNDTNPALQEYCINPDIYASYTYTTAQFM